MPGYDVQRCIFELETKTGDLHLTVSLGTGFQTVEEGSDPPSYQRVNNTSILIPRKVCGQQLPSTQSRSHSNALYNCQRDCSRTKVRYSGLVVGTTVECTATIRDLLCGCRCKDPWKENGKFGIGPDIQCGSTKFHMV